MTGQCHVSKIGCTKADNIRGVIKESLQGNQIDCLSFRSRGLSCSCGVWIIQLVGTIRSRVESKRRYKKVILYPQGQCDLVYTWKRTQYLKVIWANCVIATTVCTCSQLKLLIKQFNTYSSISFLTSLALYAVHVERDCIADSAVNCTIGS